MAFQKKQAVVRINQQNGAIELTIIKTPINSMLLIEEIAYIQQNMTSIRVEFLIHEIDGREYIFVKNCNQLDCDWDSLSKRLASFINNNNH